MKCPRTSFIFRATFGVLLVGVLPSASFAEAYLNTFFGLPAGASNGIVRIGADYNGKGLMDSGSGTVINIVPDGTGNGNYYFILTADHVARGAQQLGIAFGSGNDNYMFTTMNIAKQVQLLAPVDLAVFAVDIPKNASVPQVLLPNFAKFDPAKGQPVVQAGYGLQATVGLAPPPFMGNPAGATQGYNLTPNSYGTYIAATALTPNSVPNHQLDDRPNGGVLYNYTALQSSFSLTPPAAPTSGTAYIFPGDSGGPTFQTNGMGGLVLVGVHSDSVLHFYVDKNGNEVMGSPEWALPGDLQDDVSLGAAEQTLIAASQRQILDNLGLIPEPTAMLLWLPAGFVFLLHKRKSASRFLLALVGADGRRSKPT